MIDSNSEPPERWRRILAAAKASEKPGDCSGADASGPCPVAPPKEFSASLLGRVRAFQASLAAWQRWSLLAGLAALALFVASIIYLNCAAGGEPRTLIETPAIDLPETSTPNAP